MKMIFRAGAAIVAGAALFAGAAQAATETDTLNVSATVTNECSLEVGSGGLAFGTVDVNGGSNVQDDAQVDLTLLCTTSDATLATIQVGPGANLDGSQRRMVSGGSNYLNYQLFSDSGRTSAIPVNGTLSPNLGNTNPSPGAVVTIYGRIPAGQNLAEGSYSDTVTITTEYEPTP